MAILTFSLGPEALGKLHDALVCLGKFSDSVSFDASHDKVCNGFVCLSWQQTLTVYVAGPECFELFKIRVCILHFDW